MAFRSNQQQSVRKNGYDPNYKPTPGSVLPGKIKDELNELDPGKPRCTQQLCLHGLTLLLFPIDHKDTRKFTKKYVNKSANRKELRKQKRSEKGQKRQEYQQHMHAKIQQNKRKPQQQQQDGKAQKRPKTDTTVQPKPQQPQQKPAVKVTTPTNNDQALKKLAKTNPHLYSLLSTDELVDGRTNDDAFAEDDQYIAYWEKKLKMTKNKKFGKAFEDDGLLDVLGNLATGGDAGDSAAAAPQDGLDYLRQKRLAKKNELLKVQKQEQEAEEVSGSLIEDYF
jgi:nucleolar MIF4G domain-containing protein 1